MDARDLIIETAFDSFLQEGFDNVSLNSMIKRTGISKGAFYHHFKSKEELLGEIVNRYLISYIEQCVAETGAANSHPDLSTKLNRFIEKICAYSKHAPEIAGKKIELKSFFQLLFSVLYRNEVLKKSYFEMKTMLIEMIRNMLLSAIKDNDIRQGINTEKIAVTIYTVFRGTMFEWSISEDDDIEPLLKENINSIFEVLKVG